MEIVLMILLGLVGFMCLVCSIDLLLKGTESFLPEALPYQQTLDSVFRFLCGIYLGCGFLVIWLIIHLRETADLHYFVGIIVILSGLGRFYSRLQVGSISEFNNRRTWLEVGLGLSIVLVRYFLSEENNALSV